MRVTEELVHEHEVIKRLLGLLETACRRLDDGKEVDMDFFHGSVSFLRQFADTCHHGKEEKVLFPELERVGVPVDGGPIGQMLTEHERGRKLIAAIEDGADHHRLTQIKEAARSYVNMLRDHIVKENEVLFPLADKLMIEEKGEKVIAEFERIEVDVMGEGAHEKLLGELDRLADYMK
ncbi:hemerythrin domain-containing protein [Metallumcola ferriviriculae]|uniref:Hemerythrin domain-containing protein n=1 Tax=Metallumcola ferriviriculae TaxID=3039180 RepID=A0AAU0URV9_9FIRM|nr:hemerythrin domain-containing protein [Desulfitibacteraceae bacterium MK1]